MDSRETKTAEEKEIKRNITILEKKLKLAEEKKAKFVEEKEPPEVKEKEKKDSEVEEELLDIPTALKRQEKIKDLEAQAETKKGEEQTKIIKELNILYKEQGFPGKFATKDYYTKEKNFEQQLNKTINDLKLEIEKENENHDLLYYQTKLAEISNQITLDISASLGLVLESSDTEPF